MPGLRHVVALAAALVLAAPGCKKTPESPGTAHARKGRDDSARPAPAGPRLPEPHRLAKEPDAGAYLAKPAALLSSLDAYIPQAPALASIAELVLGTQAPADLASSLARHVVGDRPWAGVHVAGEDIIAIPVRPGPDLAAALKPFPPRGDFGAVELPAPAIDAAQRDGRPPAARLAWLDGQTNTLVFASTLQGLATSRQLAATYGGRPVWGTLSAARAAAFIPDFPYARVGVVGEGLHSLDLTALAVSGRPLPSPRDIVPGALTGMLASPEIALGASTRWPGYKKAVSDAIRELNANVDRAGFAAKMMLDPMVDQAAKVLRRWNGRAMLAVGPANHIRIGLGADEPIPAHRELLGLLRTILDNLQLARMFADVPAASMRKVADEPAAVNLLTVDGLSRNVPAIARPVFDEKGRLRVAISASEHGGGILLVIGPDPGPVLTRWLGQLSAGQAAKSTTDDLVAGVLAVSPEHLETLMREPPKEMALLGAILGLTADREPTRLVVEQKPDRYHAAVRGPEVSPRQGRPAR